jgi:LDH2 family malate/lactate/ureidoglycolate dehydrogenase
VCSSDLGERCLARTPYSYDDKKKLTCHGSVVLGIDQNSFCDAREFFRYVNELVKEKIANDEPQPEKIILCKTNRSV